MENNQLLDYELNEEEAIKPADIEVTEADVKKKKNKPVAKRCKVISYDSKTGRIVFKCGNSTLQSDVIDYDGSGYVDWEC